MIRLLTVSLVTFLSIALGAVILILVWGPTLSPARLVAFLASMFAVTGAVVAAVLTWAGAKGL